MKILVDADACPVKDIIIRLAKELSIPVMMFIDTSHILDDDYSKVIVVEKAKDSVDIALINKVEKNDIVVTQDFGVATMAISKKAYAVNQNGLIFNDNNIDRLLFERYLSQKVRRSGGKTSNAKKRTKVDNEKFEKAFKFLCEKILNNQEK
jgi:uncharacterized protein YaiI (UPF0178 family)